MSPDDVSKDEAPGQSQGKVPGKPARPSLTSATEASKAERAERVAAEMRRNLLKRKQQQREKQGDF